MVVMIGTWMQTHVSTKRKTFRRTLFCFGFYLFSFFCCWVNCHCSAPKHRCVCVVCVVRVWYCFGHRLENSTDVWAEEKEKEKERDEEDGEAQEGAKGKKQRRKAKSWSALPTATRCPAQQQQQQSLHALPSTYPLLFVHRPIRRSCGIVQCVVHPDVYHLVA